MPHLKYLSAYPEHLQTQVARLIDDDRLAAHLRQRYPHAHDIRTDKALYGYVQDLKDDELRVLIQMMRKPIVMCTRHLLSQS